jgi:hypothetical protein
VAIDPEKVLEDAQFEADRRELMDRFFERFSPKGYHLVPQSEVQEERYCFHVDLSQLENCRKRTYSSLMAGMQLHVEVWKKATTLDLFCRVTDAQNLPMQAIPLTLMEEFRITQEVRTDEGGQAVLSMARERYLRDTRITVGTTDGKKTFKEFSEEFFRK